tara:strand:+ start:5784 stop:7643 length:1860 start_codon:yes stop_codon:yes gene_type:complete
MKTIKPQSTTCRALKFDASTIDTEARTAELSFSSEASILEESFFGDRFFLVLDHSESSVRLDRLRNGAPLLIDHSNSVLSQPGVVESVSIGEDRIGRAVVRFGKSAADDEIFQKVQDGIIRNVSVRFRVHTSEHSGIQDDIDVFRSTDWEPFEISLVSVPADVSVGVGRAEGEGSRLELIETKREVKEMPDPIVVPVAPVDNTEAIRLAVESARSADQKRTSDIMAIGEDHKLRGGVDIALKAVKENQSVEDFQRDLLVHLQKPAAKFDQGAKVEDNAEKDQKRGYVNLGQFCRDVSEAGMNRGQSDLLTRAATTFGTTEAGGEGGYAIPPEFAAGITKLALAEESLLSLTDSTPVSGNTMSFVKDEGTPWGTTGITAAWEGEGNVLAQRKETELEQDEYKLKKLTVLVGATDELLSDSTAMSSHITNKMGMRLDWKVQSAIVDGTGAGQPKGITKSGALVVQAKETSQAADTFVGANAAKMITRLVGGGNAVWLMNPDVQAQMITMTIGNHLVWTPPSSGFKEAPNGLLLGKRILLTDSCETLGDQNDVILANMDGYRSITKAGGAELTQSMHLWFDQSVMAFKLIFRMDGAPVMSAPVTPPKSSVTRSHFVTLAVRT